MLIGRCISACGAEICFMVLCRFVRNMLRVHCAHLRFIRHLYLEPSGSRTRGAFRGALHYVSSVGSRACVAGIRRGFVTTSLIFARYGGGTDYDHISCGLLRFCPSSPPRMGHRKNTFRFWNRNVHRCIMVLRGYGFKSSIIARFGHRLSPSWVWFLTRIAWYSFCSTIAQVAIFTFYNEALCPMLWMCVSGLHLIHVLLDRIRCLQQLRVNIPQ